MSTILLNHYRCRAEKAETTIKAIGSLHMESRRHRCMTCEEHWPCDTAQILIDLGFKR